MAIYRGTGGSGSSTTDSYASEISDYAQTAIDKAQEASDSAAAAALSKDQANDSATLSSGSATAAYNARIAAQAARDAAQTAENNAGFSSDDAEKLAINPEDSQFTLSDGVTTGYSALHHKEKAIDAQSSAEGARDTALTYSDNALSYRNTTLGYRDAAEGHATTATTQAGIAATQASTATTQAGIATTQAGTATTQAGIATAKAGEAAGSASSAADSETNAGTSATNAGLSSADAQKLAINPEDSQFTLSDGATTGYSALHHKEKAIDAQSSAESARDAALGYRDTAAGHASTATTKAAEAATSASTATTQAGTATTQAGIATTQAGIATNKASAAATSAANAAASYDNFDDRYLGSKANDPTVDNDGDALLTGALYFNSTTDVMKVYDGAAWVAAYASIAGITLDDVTNDGNTTTNAITVGGMTSTGPVILNADPASNLGAATKQYVDTIAAAGVHYHDPVRVEQEGNLNATYDNGSSGVGATLTNSGTQEALVIDGVTLLSGDRVLIYEQTNQAQNGIYTVTDVGSGSTNWVLTRAVDADSYAPSDPDSFGQGDAFYVQEGLMGAGETYVMTTEGPITFGTTTIHFSQISSAQVYSGSTGIDITGTTISSTATLANVTTAGNSTTNSITVGGVTSTGLVTASNLNTSDWDTAYGWGNHASAGYINSTPSSLTVDTNTLHVDATNNRVAIGSTSPSYKLQVEGTIAAWDSVGSTWGTLITADNKIYGYGGGSGFDLSDSQGITPISSYGSFSQFVSLGSTSKRFESVYCQYVNTANDGNSGLWNQAYSWGNHAGLYPTYTGSGASGTWGINITGSSASCTGNAATATTASKASVTTAGSAWYDILGHSGGTFYADTACHIHGSGYLQASYFNNTHGVTTRNNDTQFYTGTSDGYIRANDAAGTRESLNVPTRAGGNASGTWAISITGNAATASDAGLLDGINSTSFLRSDTTDYLTGVMYVRADIRNETGYRDHGVYGDYDSYKTNHIWSMGSSYRNAANGSNFGTLYGLAYKHTNNPTGGTMAGGHQMVWCQNGTGIAAMGSNIWTSGNVTAYSDIRVKTNIEHIPDALDKVCQLNGYTFDRTDVKYDELTGEADKPVRQTGVIAQEVLEVLPEAVTGTEESHYSVAYGNMVGLLIEAIKEQQVQIEELKAEIDELKGAK